MTPFAAISRLSTAATLVAALTTVILRVTGHEAWHAAFGVTLALVGARVAVMAWGVARRELPWPRLLLPGIIVLEGVGLWWRGSAALWQVRLGTAVVFEVAFVVLAIRGLRRTRRSAEPPEARIAQAFAPLLPPRVARLAAFELVLVGTAVRFLAGGWRRPAPPGFTYHRESGLRMFLPMLPLLGIGDVLLLELVVLPDAAPWLRVLVHVLAVYGLIWMVGLYASLRARPHQVADGQLVLHRGILRRLVVPLDQIVSIDPLPSFADDWKRRTYCKGALRLDVAGPTILELRLRTPPGTRVLVAVDDPTAFTAALGRHDNALHP